MNARPPCELPKPLPLIWTTVPIGPDVGLMLVIVGVTVNGTPFVAVPAVTTMFPVVAPVGTGAVMLVFVHCVGVAAVPLKVRLPVVPKFVPTTVIGVPGCATFCDAPHRVGIAVP